MPQYIIPLHPAVQFCTSLTRPLSSRPFVGNPWRHALGSGIPALRFSMKIDDSHEKTVFRRPSHQASAPYD
ncbi:protein of unknown function [Rhodovastum atsumiense]|nr:protein of unknown function [Rhodovastum atsumiense]